MLFPRLQLVRAILLAPLLAVTLVAHGADKPKAEAPPGGGGKGAGAYLTRDQLRDCFARQDRLTAEDAELVREQAAVQTEQDVLARQGEDMTTQLAAVDRTKAESVDAYNAAVEARNRGIELFQARAAAFNARVEANGQAHAAYGPACSNRRYFDEDAAALRKNPSSSSSSSKP